MYKNGKIITIVIPAYNMENYLDKCCSSLVINSNLDAVEVLIINDGSKDNTSNIGHKFEDSYRNIFRIIDKENGNYGSCINRGLKEAKGKYIKILDADDSFDTDGFEQLVEKLIELVENEQDVDLVVTDMRTVDETGKSTGKRKFEFAQNRICGADELEYKKMYSLTHHAITFRTQLLRDMGFVQTEGISYTDQEWARLPMLAVQKFIYYPIQVYVYLFGRAGQTMDTTIITKNIWMSLRIKEKMLDFYQEKKDLYPEQNRRCLQELLLYHLNNVYRHYLLTSYEYHNPQEILEFDLKVKEKYPDFYALMENIRANKYYPVRYIKLWRESINEDSKKFRGVQKRYRLARKIGFSINKLLRG